MTYAAMNQQEFERIAASALMSWSAFLYDYWTGSPEDNILESKIIEFGGFK